MYLHTLRPNSCQVLWMYCKLRQACCEEAMNSTRVHPVHMSVHFCRGLTSFHMLFNVKTFRDPCRCDLPALQLKASATIYSSSSSRLLIKDPSVSSVAWNLQPDVGGEVSYWACSFSMRKQTWWESFTLLPTAKHIHQLGYVVIACWVLLSLSLALHTTGWLHVTQITVKSPHRTIIPVAE